MNQTAMLTAKSSTVLGGNADEELDVKELGLEEDGKLNGEVPCEPAGELDGE